MIQKKKHISRPQKKSSSPKEKVRAHVWYSGRVQGVGFRHTVDGFALEIGLTGWVKNMPDGRVELICEGGGAQINDLLNRIQESVLGKHIRKTETNWQKATGEFSDFSVEFYY